MKWIRSGSFRNRHAASDRSDQRFDEKAGFFFHFTAHTCVPGLAEFEDAAGDLPLAGATALDDHNPAGGVGDDGGDADGMARAFGLGHRLFPSNRQSAAVASSCRLYRPRESSRRAAYSAVRTWLLSGAGPAVVKVSSRPAAEGG